MQTFVTITFDPATDTTSVTQSAAPHVWSSFEPEGMVGACRLGSFYASSVSRLTIRRVRDDAARAAS